jgi:lysophospholipid acyltransferase (LPLAT)-like uncharacterized protein
MEGCRVMKIRLSPTVTSFLGALVIRALGATWRIEWRGLDRVAEARGMSSQVIYAFWHGRLLVLSYSHRNRGVQVLASEHPDGDLMGRTITRLGFGHRKGSTTRGGASALRDLSSLLREGFDVGLTIDGPRGPRGTVQQGAIELGRMTASAIVPITNSARPRVLFKSWDRFQLPLPFAKVVIDHGEPFLVPAGTEREERERYRVGLERGLAELTSGLDAELGYERDEVWPHEDH